MGVAQCSPNTLRCGLMVLRLASADKAVNARHIRAAEEQFEQLCTEVTSSASEDLCILFVR